jgi:ParB-like chromosome segregation protein Spo0J
LSLSIYFVYLHRSSPNHLIIMAATVVTPLSTTDLSELAEGTYHGLPEEIRKEKRKDIYEVDPRLLRADHKDNWRTEYGDLEGLKQIIRENGVPGILSGKREVEDGVDYYRVYEDGFRRAKAVEELLAEGTDPGMITFRLLPKYFTEESRVKSMLLLNGGKNFTALEEGRVYVELEENFQYTRKKIALTYGKSEPHVCNMIQLAKNGGVLVDEVEAGRISTTSAVKVMKAVPDEAQRKQVIDKGLQIAAERGKTKATDKDLAQAADMLLNLPAADESLLERDELPGEDGANQGDEATVGMPELFDGVDDQKHTPARVPSAPDPLAADKKSLKSAGEKIASADKTMKKLLELQDEIPVVGKLNISQQTIKKVIDYLNGKVEKEDMLEYINE